MKAIAFSMVEGIFVVVHGPHEPTDEDWDEHLRYLKPRIEQIRGLLVVTEGSRPNAQHRERIRQLWSPRGLPPLAVVTPSRLARNTAGLLTWFFRNRVRVFLPAELPAAFAFLHVDAHLAEKLMATIAALRSEIGAEPLFKAGS